MPTIDVSQNDLFGLLGKKLSKNELEEALEFIKGELDGIEGDRLKIDVKETVRPEVWSTEGIARELRLRMGIQKKPAEYKIHSANYELFIEPSVEKSRPFIASAVIKDISLTQESILQIIQLQEKIRRSQASKNESGGGLYDFDKLRMPMYFKGLKDQEVEFIPLEWKVPMHPSEILAEHPKGKEFGFMLKGKDRYPIVMDSAGQVASMPPIINSDTTGKITTQTRNIFVEVTGWNWKTVTRNLNALIMALADRGGKIYSVKTHFPKTATYPKKPINTPFFETQTLHVSLTEWEALSGLKLSAKELMALAHRSGFEAKISGKKMKLTFSGQRRDVMHPVDLFEDLLICHGYNRIQPLKPELLVRGNHLPRTLYLDRVRDVCTGMGLQEILTFNLTSKEKQSSLIGLNEPLVEIANPMTENWALLRRYLFPEHLSFLNQNKRFDFPQKIFEIGSALEPDPTQENGVREHTTLCIVLSGKGHNVNDIKSLLQAVCLNLGYSFEIKESILPFLKEGKQATFTTPKGKGFLGEVNEKTLKAFGLEQETVLMEMEI
ncbi:MAG: phenylalanine--tRNA ligase subunit beta [Candidatus Diapherotrites archaeon]|nr:phenylalanine--tRNA ligase subunit beta [Candidatus Diapherotrites archaeon]